MVGPIDMERIIKATDIRVIQEHADKIIPLLADGYRRHGRGCAVMDASGLQETGVIRWGYLPMNGIPEQESSIKEFVRRCSRPLHLSVVVILKPGGSRSYYLVSYMVDMVDDFPRDHLCVIEGGFM